MDIPIVVHLTIWVLAYAGAVIIAIPNTIDAYKSLQAAKAGRNGDGKQVDRVSVAWAWLFFTIQATLGGKSTWMLGAGLLSAFTDGNGGLIISILTLGAVANMALSIYTRYSRHRIFKMLRERREATTERESET